MITDKQALEYVKELKEYCTQHPDGCGYVYGDCALHRVCNFNTCIDDLNEVEEEEN